MLSSAKYIVIYAPYRKDKFAKEIESKFRVIENGVLDSELLRARPTKKRNSLVFINNLSKAHAWKGLDAVLEMVKSYKENYDGAISLSVVGDGNNRSAYEEMARALGIEDNVVFHGEKKGEEKNNVLQHAEILLCYPTTANDAFPTIIMEAWAHYTAVICANIGPLPFIIKDTVDGILVPASSPLALAKSVHELLARPKFLYKLTTNGRMRVEETYTWSKLGAKTDKLFSESIK